jgi:hypothetical protein
MKKVNYILLSIISLMTVGVLFMSGTTQATYNSTMVNLNNSFSTGNFSGPSLQERIDIIVADLLNNHVLDHEDHWNSWADLIEAYVEGGTNGSNIYGYANPVSENNKPYYGQLVLNGDRVGSNKKNWNPMLFITSSFLYDYNWVSHSSDLSKLYGSLIIYKPFWEQQIVYYYIIEENGNLGQLQSFELP